MNTADTVMYLASCAVNETAPDPAIIPDDIDGVISLASKHMISALVSMSLESAGVSNEIVKSKIASSVRMTMYYDSLSVKILRCFEDCGIWYMPLKGAVMKGYYSRLGMREMTDRDILIDASKAADVRSIMEGLGFECESFALGRHDIYSRDSLFTFEMHRGLLHEDKFSAYYSGVKDRLIKDSGNNYGYHFRPEDFYVYMTAHGYRHYSRGGTGIRSLTDEYVFIKKFWADMDIDYVMREVNALGISDFEKDIRTLAMNLFGGVKESYNREMLDYITDSGAFGNVQNRVANNTAKYGGGLTGKIKYILARIFIPQEAMRDIYPSLGKYKVLYPFLALHRMIKALVNIRGKVFESESELLKRI